MRVVVSGVNGFVGGYVARELVEHGHDVVGLGRSAPPDDLAALLAEHVTGDLVESWPDIVCDAVIHLAALSAVGPSFTAPQRYLAANTAPLTNLGELMVARGSSARVLVISTGAVYAPGIGLAESAATSPSSPYAVSKLFSETQCAYYRRRGLDMVVMRPFNHIGPAQGKGFLLPDLVAGVRTAHDLGQPLRVGNLETRRDYTDVRDVARAYRLAIEAETVSVPVLNVCSGSSVSGRSMLEAVAKEIGIPTPRTEIDPERVRPSDPAEIRGDSSLIRETLGWTPAVDLTTTVRDVVAEQAC